MGILTNDNFSVNAPKIIDDRYSTAGVTPYTSVAAANTAISLTRRAIGLTVNVNTDEYWYKNGTADTDLILKSAGGGASVVSITKAALLALIAANTVIVGTTYAITDAQDALSGVITVTGATTNSVDGNGRWIFTGKLPAQGAFKLQSGTSGSVDQITVVMPTGTKNLMTASVPYTTSRNNTATLVVANINANTAVSGCRAFVITSPTTPTNFDTPLIVIEAIETTTSFVHTMTPSTTTLVVANAVNPTLGFTPNNLVLYSYYDVTNDRILRVYDVTMDCLVENTVARITALTYNPVTTYRWRDPRFTSFVLINSGYRNVRFTNPNIAPFVWKNIKMTDTTISGVVFTNLAHNLVELLSGTTITNVNCTIFNFTQTVAVLNISNVECSQFTISNHNRGTVTFTNVSLGDATTKPNITLTGNAGFYTFTTIASSSTTVPLTMSSCTAFNLIVVTLNALTISGGATLTNNRFFATTNFATSSTVQAFSMIDCEILQPFIFTGNTHTGNITIARTRFLGTSTASFNVTGCTLPAITITDNSNLFFSIPTASTPTTFNISNSNIDNSTTYGKLGGNFNISNSNIYQSSSISTTLSGLTGAINISFANLKNVNLAKVKSIQIQKSDLQSSSFTDPSNLGLNVFTCNGTTLNNADLQSDPLLFAPNVSLSLTNCLILDTVVFTNGTCTYANTTIDNSTVSIGAPTTANVTNSKIKNATVKLRTDIGTITFANNDLLSVTLIDRLDVSSQPFNNCNISNNSMTNATIYVADDTTSHGCIITGCTINNTGLIDFNQTFDTNLINTTIDNGKYRITHNHDFSLNNLIVGTPFLISDIYPFFVFNSVTYSSFNSLVGAGAKLGLGYSTTYNQYINDVLITVINAAGSTRTSGGTDTTTIIQDLSLNATIANITAGTLKLVLEGEIFN